MIFSTSRTTWVSATVADDWNDIIQTQLGDRNMQDVPPKPTKHMVHVGTGKAFVVVVPHGREGNKKSRQIANARIGTGSPEQSLLRLNKPRNPLDEDGF